MCYVNVKANDLSTASFQGEIVAAHRHEVRLRIDAKDALHWRTVSGVQQLQHIQNPFRQERGEMCDLAGACSLVIKSFK